MYRRMYGTRHPVTPHHLIPIEHEPWLQKKSMVPTVKRLFLGSLCLILLTVMVFPFGQMGLVPDAVGVVLLLLSGLAVLVALLCLTLLVEMVLCRDPYQYCPDCLSYMTRGAKVCPFCGFRPEAPLRPVSPQPLARQRALG
jgi:hypothetical protein